MNKRPVSVTIIGCIYILAGIGGCVAHAAEWKTSGFVPDALLPTLVNLVALVCGVCMLRGANWARWLALGWIGFHVALSVFDAPSKLAAHSLMAAVLAYFLTRGAGARYFRPTAA